MLHLRLFPARCQDCLKAESAVARETLAVWRSSAFLERTILQTVVRARQTGLRTVDVSRRVRPACCEWVDSGSAESIGEPIRGIRQPEYAVTEADWRTCKPKESTTWFENCERSPGQIRFARCANLWRHIVHIGDKSREQATLGRNLGNVEIGCCAGK